jgi:SAM-dependent methyltransferase
MSNDTLAIDIVHSSASVDELYSAERAKQIRSKDENLSSGMWQSFSAFVSENSRHFDETLDVCCGTGRYFPYIKSKSFVGIDLSQHMLELASLRQHRPPGKLIRCDVNRLRELPELKDRFGFLFCQSSLDVDTNLGFLDVVPPMIYCASYNSKICFVTRHEDSLSVEKEISRFMGEGSKVTSYDIHIMTHFEMPIVKVENGSNVSRNKGSADSNDTSTQYFLITLNCESS